MGRHEDSNMPHLRHVDRLRGEVKHAGLQQLLHHDLAVDPGLLQGVQHRVVLVGDAEVVAGGAPEHQEVRDLPLGHVLAAVVLGVEEVLAEEG